MNAPLRGLFSFVLLVSLSSCTFNSELKVEKDLASSITAGGVNYDTAMSYIRKNHPPRLPRILSAEYLDSDSPDVKKRIIAALCEYRVQDTYQEWIEMLKNAGSSNDEIEILDNMGRLKHSMFLVPISDKLLVPRSEVREKAAKIIRKTGDDRALPVILSLADRKNPIDRIYFLEALNHLYDMRFQKRLIAMLEDDNKSVRIYALKCAVNNSVKEALPAIRKLTAGDENPEVRKAGISSLVKFRDSSSGGILSQLLKDEDREIRIQAIRALADMKMSQNASSISDMLVMEKDRLIMDAALDALISFRKTGSTAGLRHIIKNDPEPEMRIKAVYALGVAGNDRSSLELLKEALEDENYRVRGEACNAISYMKDRAVSDILIRQIKTDRSRYVRSAALFSVVRIGDPKSVVKLFDIYSSEDDQVFREILRGILRKNIERKF